MVVSPVRTLPPLPSPPANLARPSHISPTGAASSSLSTRPWYPDISQSQLSILGLARIADETIDKPGVRSGGFFGSEEDEPEYGAHCGRAHPRTVGGKQLEPIVLKGTHRKLTLFEVSHHAAVLVAVDRRRPVAVVESMPFSSRLGCQLLYHGLIGHEKLLDSIGVEKLFRKWSKREGRKFDSPRNALHRILSYARAYHIDCSELLQPDLRRYATLNDFFFRQLRKGARPIAEPSNPLVISSAADCRLTVFLSLESAQKLWIKGRHFTLEQLLGSEKLARHLKNGCVAIFRLAPADYHRYHSPVDAIVGRTKHVDGKYYTVNSLIVQDPGFDPLGENKRDVTVLYHTRVDGTTSTIAFVQVGALLVSSIRQTVDQDAHIERGEEIGYFAYGGSTIVCMFEAGSVAWDPDLLRNSMGENEQGLKLETMVKVGERIGQWRQ